MFIRNFTTSIALFLWTTVFMGGIESQTSAETVQLNASRDNTLFNSDLGAISNGRGSLFAGRTGDRGPGAQRALIAFDVASEIPSNAVITEVQLILTVLQAGANSDDETYTLHRVEQDWGEGDSSTTGGGGAAAETGDATWIHTFFDDQLWTNPGGDFEGSASASGFPTGSGPAVWGTTPELVADVQGWLDDPSSNFGWILIGDESRSQSSRQFASREASRSTPELSVTFTVVPEPTSFALAGIALSALMMTRRLT